MSRFNHTCLNPNCPNKIVGADGTPQNNYYACDECDRNRGITWRSLCCTKECFEEYAKLFLGKKKEEPAPQENKQTSTSKKKTTLTKNTKSQKKNTSIKK